MVFKIGIISFDWCSECLLSDGLTDCEDPDCCIDIACRESIHCRIAPDPMEILLRKQPPSTGASFYDRMRFLVEDESVQSYATLSSFNQTWVRRLRTLYVFFLRMPQGFLFSFSFPWPLIATYVVPAPWESSFSDSYVVVLTYLLHVSWVPCSSKFSAQIVELKLIFPDDFRSGLMLKKWSFWNCCGRTFWQYVFLSPTQQSQNTDTLW